MLRSVPIEGSNFKEHFRVLHNVSLADDKKDTAVWLLASVLGEGCLHGAPVVVRVNAGKYPPGKVMATLECFKAWPNLRLP